MSFVSSIDETYHYGPVHLLCVNLNLIPESTLCYFRTWASLAIMLLCINISAGTFLTNNGFILLLY